MLIAPFLNEDKSQMSVGVSGFFVRCKRGFRQLQVVDSLASVFDQLLCWKRKTKLNDTNRDSLHHSSVSQQNHQIRHDPCSLCVCLCVRCWLLSGPSVNDLIILKPMVLYAVTSSDSVERQDIPSAQTHARRCHINDLHLFQDHNV